MAKVLPKEDAVKKRLGEWEQWLAQFKTQKKDILFKYIPEAPKLLNNLYWTLAKQYLRPVVGIEDASDHRIHQYKIISASEIAVMMTEPIFVIGDPDKAKILNASFAWFVATQIMESWDTGTKIKIKNIHIQKIARYQEQVKKDPISGVVEIYKKTFTVEHIQWLAALNVTVEKPLLLNAQCWRLFHHACLAIATKGQLPLPFIKSTKK